MSIMTSSVNSAAPADLLGQPVSTDNEAMQLALQLTRRAADAGEVPVGALVVPARKVIGQGYNQPITTLDPSAHAEMVAVRHATATVANCRRGGAAPYGTVAPCTMCTGLLIHSRIGRLVFGATEPKAGAVVSALQLPQQSFYNHVLQADGGVMAEESAALMSEFFALRRAAQK